MPVAEPAEGAGPASSHIDGFQTAHVVTIGLAHGLNDTYTSLLAPLLPALIAKLAMSKTQAGMLAFVQSSPWLFQPVIGHLADRVNLRYAVIVAPGIAATTMSLLGVAPHTGVVALLVMVTGLSSASLHAIAPAMAGRLSGLRLGRGMGFWVVGGYVGLAMGPIVAVTGVKLLTLEGTPWLMIGGWLGSGILYWRLRHVEQHTAMRVEESAWRAVFQGMRPILVPVVGILVARALVMSSVLTFVTESLAAVVLGALGDLFGLDLAFAAGAVLLLSGLPLVLLLPKDGSEWLQMALVR